MREPTLVVLDSSVGVKWFKDEPGTTEARELLRLHRDRAVRLVVPAHFIVEVAAVATRHDTVVGERVWKLLRLADLTVVALDDTLAAGAFSMCRSLGCSFYEALAPALAEYLGVPLYSADARAHGRVEGVRILG